MSLEFEARQKEGITILSLKGRITAGAEASALRDRMKEIAAEPARVILDLAGVDYVDSTGLGSLVISFTTLRKAGGELKLLNLSRRNIELLVLTKLTTVFEIFTDEQDAVNSFFPEREIKPFDILEFVQQGKKES